MATFYVSESQYFWYWGFQPGDTILVQTGGFLDYIEIPSDVASVTLEAGAGLNGWIRTAREFTVQGEIVCNEAVLTLDISGRTPEDTVMVNDCSLMNLDALILCIGSDMAEGDYRVLGNAASFTDSIRVIDTRYKEYGTVSLTDPELYNGFNHYMLHLNEADELCLTVSSAIPEGAKILLFNDGKLVDTARSRVLDLIMPTDGYDQMIIMADGLANGILVSQDAVMTVMDGGVAESIHVDNGTLNVLSGGKATDVAIDNSATIRVEGGIIDDIRTNYALFVDLYIGESGIIRNMDLCGFGLVDGDYRTSTFTVDAGGRLENSILSGSWSTILRHEALIKAGGTVFGVTLAGGREDVVICLVVYGESYDTVLIGENASLFLKEGGRAYGTVLNHYNAAMTVTRAEAVETEVKLGALHVSAGGTIRDTRLNAGYEMAWNGDGWVYGLFGEIVVSEGGLSLDTLITAGSQTVKGGGVASRTELVSGGCMIVNGGLASETVLSDGGVLEVDRGGVALDVHAVRDAAIKVGAGGLASSVALDTCNMMVVASKGRAEDVNVAARGYVYLQDGGVLGGRMQLADGAVVYAFEGGGIDFDLSKANATTALLSDFSLITGTPNFSITITADIAANTYLLADGAADFNGSISVQDDRFSYGELSLSDPLVVGWNTYTLNLNQGTLCLTVTRNATEAPFQGISLEGEMVYGMSVQEGETSVLSDGLVYYGVSVNDGASVTVESGTKLDTPLVNSGAFVTVADGGSVDNMFITTSGRLDVLSGGKATNVITDNAYIRVEGGEIDGIKRADLDPYYHWFGTLDIGVGGTVRNADLYALTWLEVGSDGLLDHSRLLGAGWAGWYLTVYVRAGATTNVVSVEENSTISLLGVANDTVLRGSKATLNMYESARASGTVIDYYNAQMTLSGALATDTEVLRGALHVSSGGTIRNTKLDGVYDSAWDGNSYVWKQQGEIVVSNGGLSLDTVITAGELTVKGGGVASRTELISLGRLVVNGGQAEETTLKDGGQMVVRRGGVARGIHAVKDGGIEVGSDALASSVELDAYNTMMVSGGGRVEDVTVASGGEVYLQGGAVLGGQMQLTEGAIVFAFDGGTIDFDLTKANASTALLNDLSVITGAPDFTITVSADTAPATYVLSAGAAGFAGTITVQDEAKIYGDLAVNGSLVYGWNTYALNLNDGTLSLTVTRNATAAPAEGEDRVTSDKTVYAALVQPMSSATVSSGYTYIEATMNTWGILFVESGGRVEESLVKPSGTLSVQGGTADNIELYGGNLEVLSGGKVTNVKVTTNEDRTDGAWERIRVVGGELDGMTKYIMGFIIGDVYIADHGIIRNAALGIPSSVTVDVDGVLDDCTLAGGSIIVLSGGTVSDLVDGHTGFGGGTVYLYGVANDVSIINDGTINVYDGGVASGTKLEYFDGVLAARGYVSSGGSAAGTVVSRGELHVSSGGTLTNTVVNGEFTEIWDSDINDTVWRPVGEALVSEGGISLDANVKGGRQTVKRGGIASRTLLTSSGHMAVLNGGLASETTLSGGGRLIVSRGGMAEDVRAVHDGAIEICSDGLVSSAVLGAVNMMTVLGGGLAEDVTVSSGGEVRLLKDGVLGGHIHLADGAVVSAAKGGIVDFDISQADSETALLDNLSAVVGAPEFTITVSADTMPGTYRLADGAAGFTGTITVRDAGNRYGDLSLTDALTYGWNTYTLNLVDDALSLSIVKNDEFVAPPDDDLEIVVTSDSNTVSAGEILHWEKTGETVRVTAGGILQNTEIPWGGTLILEENSTLLDSIRLGTDVLVEGRVNASNAFLELDISSRKEEYGTILSDLALLAASSYTVLVDPDQNKGEYILAGNSQNFYGSIAVKGTDGTYRGAVSLSQSSVDYGVTRYTLVQRDNNDLVFIVSSTFKDETSYILLYKERFLVLAKEAVSNITVSRNSEYDQIVVIDKGVAEWITIGDGGVAQVEAGGYLLVTSQAWDGRLRFDYTAGDSTVIKGINRYGAYFYVENDQMVNVCGENLNVSGAVSIQNYYGTGGGALVLHDGATLTGEAAVGDYQFYSATIHDFKLNDAWNALFFGDSVVLNTEWNCSFVEISGNVSFDHAVFNSQLLNMHGGAISDATFNSIVSIYGGTLSDVVFNDVINVRGFVQVYGDLVFNAAPYYDFKWFNPYFDMHGHTAVFDYTVRTEDDDATIMLDAFSEDVVFQLNMNRDQFLGKYKISSDQSLECNPAVEGEFEAGARRGLVDTYNICIDGTIVGTIDGDHPSFVYGDYVYTMACEDDTELFLTIDVADSAGDDYKVLWYNSDKSAGHAASASGLTIGGDSDCVEVVVLDGGILGGSELNAGGVLRVQSGGLVADLVQEELSVLRFDYTEGDSTAITGSNQYGTFTVRNDMLGNVYGENITVNGGISIHNYHGTGLLTARALHETGSEKNVTMTGTISGGDYKLYDTDISDFVLEGAGQFDYYSGTIDNARFKDATVYIRGGSVSNTVFDTYVGLFNGKYANIELNRYFYLFGPVTLTGDITVRAQCGFELNSIIQVNGHTVNADYTNRTVYDFGLLSLRTFSEDANFRLLFRDDQKTGTYILAENAGSLIDYFTINVGGVDTEVLSAQHTEMDYNGYHYTLAHNVENQQILLTISATEGSVEDLSVSYLDAETDTVYYTESLNGFVIDGEHYMDLHVKDKGFVSNTELAFAGDMTVEAGGKVITLDQKTDGHLQFDYEENDTTVISGMNPYGAFFVEDNLLENVYGLYVSVTGNVLVNKYHNAGGTLTIDGGTASGRFDGSGSLNISNAVVTGFSVGGQTLELEKVRVEDACFDGGYITLGRGTYSEVVVNGDWFIDGIFTMDGDLTLQSSGRNSFDSHGTIGYDMTFEYSGSGISGNGNTINLDLTNRSVTDSAFISLGRVYNTELQVTLDLRQPIGTYTLATDASQIGLKDFTGVLDQESNQWLFRGATVGDLDGVITIYDVNGIELANCTVNGDTEYYGRYNYKVFVDDIGQLKLKVGWNNRDGLTYAADEKEQNDTMETATVISGSGKDVVRALTIHSGTDVDYFKFTLESPGRKSSYIGIDFKQWAGDLDISLYNDNGVLIDYARSVTDNERLSLSGFAAGTYYLKVSGYNGNLNEYKLVYDLPETTQMVDDYETGDDPSTPYFLEQPEGQITINANISRPEDVDYYMFVLPEKGLVSDVISMSYDDEFGDLDLFLYDRDGTTLLVSSTNTVGGQERITMAGLQAGVYYAAVRSKDASIGRYELVFDVNSHEVNSDRFETNDTMKKATKLHTLNGKKTLDGLSIHSDEDVDYYRFSILEKGSADDSITLTCEPSLGDLDIEVLNADGVVVAYSRTAEIDDVVCLKGLDVGEYYIRVFGYNNVANNYSLSWNVTNSALIPSDPYEGNEPILLRENQTVTGLSIAKVCEEDETREDTFKIVLEYNAWKRSKIILTDYRSDWEEGMAYVIRDGAGNVLREGKDSEISLYGLTKGDYYLTLDTPNENEYSEYTLITQNLPDSDNAKDNAWSIFIYVAADNNLENCLMKELLFMQSAILPEDVEVYVLMDRAEGMSVADRNWTDTRVGKLRHSKGAAVAIEWMYFDGVNTNTYADTHNSHLQKEWDTGNVATLEAFLDWGMQEARAEHYALIMTDHGSSLGFNSSDGASKSIMSIQEIANLLRSEKYDDLSVVAFEQCEMGSDVVVTTMEGTVDYIVASEAIGWVPNWMIRYDVLLNSLDPEMTSRELAQKLVDSCDCSGYLDLTMASFKTADNNLSEALNQFGALASEFTYADWIALCKSFSKVHNYGDEICAYSDLGSLLNQIRSYHTTISSTLMDAANTLYDAVMNTVIDGTKITPEIYGTGLAVFNPVLSDPMMASHSYGGGSKLDYYATSIGGSAWGDFMFTLSRMADDCSDYIVDANGTLTFTDYSYYYESGEVRNSYNLGAFSGNGVSFSGLYMDGSAYYDITLMQPGEEGDAIVVTADNPNAKITVYLIQTLIPSDKELANGDKPKAAVRRRAEDGILTLDGVDYDKNRAFNEYNLVITSTEETTYSIDFVGNWTTGVDYFDYSRAKSISALTAGNNSIDKATVLPSGRYGGLVTCAGDEDYYKVLAVYADTLDVTVKGTGLVVSEYNAAGDLLQTAVEENGEYKLTVANENYVCVSGSSDIAANACDPYTLTISEAAQTYLKAELGAMLPEKPVVTSQFTDDNEVMIEVTVADGLDASYSTDLQKWDPYEGSFVTDQNGRYYFRAVDPTTGVESRYVSLMVTGIDKEPPAVGRIVADVTDPTNGDVIVTAEFSDDIEVAYGLYWIGEDGQPQEYENGVTLTENVTVYFQAVDVAGNTSAIVSHVVSNIDKVPPAKPTVTADVIAATNGDVLVSAEFSEDSAVKEYSLDGGQTWTAYTAPVKFEANGSVTFRAKDAVGNPAETTYEVANIDKVPPAKPTVTADVVDLTGGDVLVSAEFSEDSTVKEYSLDGGETWTAYTAPVKFEKNGSVTFRAKDASGNPAETTYEVANIDKVPPVLTISGDNQTPLQKTTLTAAVDDGSPIRYKIDDSEWMDYAGEISVGANATYYFKATDAAENEDAKQITFANIDTVAPVAPVASADVTAPTNTDVNVSAEFSADSVKTEFSLDGVNWKTYTGPIRFAENGTVSFRGTDAAGNISEATTYEVSNIDKVALEKPIATADILFLTNTDVRVSAIFPEGAVAKEYSRDNQTWQPYTEAIVLSENGTVYFRNIDDVGNISEVTAYEVANIDKVAPKAPAAVADVVAATNGDVFVSATFSDDSTVREYSLDGGETWIAYTGAVKFEKNGSVTFRGTDEAGNPAETTYEVTNIDKVPPVITLSGDNVTPAQSATVTASVDDGSPIVYSTDETNWSDYTGTITVTANATYYFKATDAAGNVGKNSCTFANIDTLPPVIFLSGNNQSPVQKATLTATVDDGSEIRYSLDQETWTKYEGEITVTANATYYFMATDAAGNEGTNQITFNNIDLAAPVITLSGDNHSPLQKTTLTATVDDGSSIYYSLDQETWTKYEGEISVTANATYYFTATDAAGNVGTAEYVFANIDTVPPVAPFASADVTAPTNTDVNVSAEFSADSVKTEFSLDGVNWKVYTGPIRFAENGTVSFRGTDAAGNVSEATTYEVANIDKVALDKPIATANILIPTNTDVRVSAIFPEGAVAKEFSRDNQTWEAYTEAIVFSENGTVYFRNIDGAGNISEVTTYEVTNIDKVAPEKPVAVADVTELTNKDVTVSATFSDDSVKKEYSLDGQTWQDYPEGGVIIIINGTVGFRGIDEAGNVSEVTSYKVENIDKVAPEAPASLAAIVADQTVTLNWSASTDLSGVKGYIVTYAHDGQEFTANTTETSFVIENADFATWQWNVQAVDAVGNVSAAAAGEAFTVVEAVEPEPETKYVAKFDISGNGVSDVMFVWTGANGEGNYQHGYWMDGTSTWQSANVGHPAEWENLGCYDMAGDGRADSVLVGNVVVNDVKGAYIGYYADANDTDANWTNIGYLNNADDIDWKNKVGKLTGGAANSIVWYAPELYALGAWTDGTDSWTTISNSFGGADWGLVGCGDFNGNGKDSVVMSGLGGMYFYTADLDGTVAAMGSANWSGWEVRAIGDFLGDGKDDLVLFHPEYGSMVMLADGNLDAFASIGQLDANDWFVVGAGDYNGDQKDDLLVRQYSTGMLGYYTSGDTTQWNTLGYGVDMSWIVIA